MIDEIIQTFDESQMNTNKEPKKQKEDLDEIINWDMSKF